MIPSKPLHTATGNTPWDYMHGVGDLLRGSVGALGVCNAAGNMWPSLITLPPNHSNAGIMLRTARRFYEAVDVTEDPEELPFGAGFTPGSRPKAKGVRCPFTSPLPPFPPPLCTQCHQCAAQHALLPPTRAGCHVTQLGWRCRHHTMQCATMSCGDVLWRKCAMCRASSACVPGNKRNR